MTYEIYTFIEYKDDRSGYGVMDEALVSYIESKADGEYESSAGIIVIYNK